MKKTLIVGVLLVMFTVGCVLAFITKAPWTALLIVIPIFYLIGSHEPTDLDNISY